MSEQANSGHTDEREQPHSYGRRAEVLGAAAAGVGAAAALAAPGVAQAAGKSVELAESSPAAAIPVLPAVQSRLAKDAITSAILTHIAETQSTRPADISLSVKFKLKWAPGEPLTRLTQPPVNFLVQGKPVPGG